MERGDHDVAPVGRVAESPFRESLGLVQTPLVCGDERNAAQPPRWVEVCSFLLVAVDGRLGHASSFVPLTAVQEQARELDQVEGIVASRPGLRPDELVGLLDRPVEVVSETRQTERAPVGALSLPRSSIRRDEAQTAFDVPAPRRPDEPQLGVGAEEERIGEEVRVDRAVVPIQDRDRLVDDGQPAFEVEPHDKEREDVRTPWPAGWVVAPASERHLFAHGDRIRDASVVVAQEGTKAERIGTSRTRRSVPERGFEDRVRLHHLRQVDEEALGRKPSSVEATIGPVGAGRPAGLQVERGGVERRAAAPRVAGCIGEGVGDRLVRLGRGSTEVARAGVR
jgi:hypothetical protein